jgi:hypothetical protein
MIETDFMSIIDIAEPFVLQKGQEYARVEDAPAPALKLLLKPPRVCALPWFGNPFRIMWA